MGKRIECYRCESCGELLSEGHMRIEVKQTALERNDCYQGEPLWTSVYLTSSYDDHHYVCANIGLDNRDCLSEYLRRVLNNKMERNRQQYNKDNAASQSEAQEVPQKGPDEF
jgi:hypothetical protein